MVKEGKMTQSCQKAQRVEEPSKKDGTSLITAWTTTGGMPKGKTSKAADENYTDILFNEQEGSRITCIERLRRDKKTKKNNGPLHGQLLNGLTTRWLGKGDS